MSGAVDWRAASPGHPAGGAVSSAELGRRALNEIPYPGIIGRGPAAVVGPGTRTDTGSCASRGRFDATAESDAGPVRCFRTTADTAAKDAEGVRRRMSELKDWMHAAKTSAAMFREASESLDRAVVAMAEQLPPLGVHARGGSLVHRYPEKSVDVALALKLIQLRGNIRAGEVLIREGLFLEWDMVQRSMHDALEDATLLAAVDEEDKVVRRYIEFFFDEDLDKNGELTNRGLVGVGRQEVRKAIEKTAGRHSLPESGSKMARQSRQLHRMRSGSVHGRAASIMRAYFEESVSKGLWLGGHREWRRTAWELPGLRMVTSQALSTFGLAGIGRWWEPARCLALAELGQRLQETIDVEIAALKAIE